MVENLSILCRFSTDRNETDNFSFISVHKFAGIYYAVTVIIKLINIMRYPEYWTQNTVHGIVVTLSICFVVLVFITNDRVAAAAAVDSDEDDAVHGDVMQVVDADSQRTSNERLAASASQFISNYILAKLLGTSPARLPTGILLSTDISLDVFPKVPSVSYPVFPRAYEEVSSEPISDAAATNKSTNVNVEDAATSQVEEESLYPTVRRVPVTSSVHQGHDRLDVNQVRETLMEWDGQRGRARSVSNAASNLVVFAPLFPGTAVRKPQVVMPTASSVTMLQRSAPSTAPSSLSSLRAIIEKSIGEETDDGGSMSTSVMTGDVQKDKHISENVSTTELEPFKSGPEAADMDNEQLEDIGLIAQDQDYVTPVTGFHLRPRLLPNVHSDSNKRDRTSLVSMLLSPDSAPWTISEDPQPSPLAVVSEAHDVKATLDGSESTKAASLATTDPTVYMYTVLSSATRQPVHQQPHHIHDVTDDDVGDDVMDDVRDDVMESESTEVSSDGERTDSALEDRRRLSSEFLGVMQSLWPGVKLCAQQQCNSDALLVSSSDQPFTALPLNTDYHFPAMTGSKQKLSASDDRQTGEETNHATSTQPVTTSTASVDDVTDDVTESLSTPSWWQVRRSIDSTSTSPSTSVSTSASHGIARNVDDHQLTLFRRKTVRAHLTSDEQHDEALRSTTTTSDVNTFTRELAASMISSSLTPRPRTVNTNRNRPALNVAGSRRPAPRPPLHVHRLDAHPTHRRPFHQRHGALPPDFSFRRNPTIVRPRTDLRGLPNRTRVQIDSGLIRSRTAESQINEEVLQHLGSPFSVNRLTERTHHTLPDDRRISFAPEGSEHEKLLEHKSTSSLVGLRKLINGVREENGAMIPPATIRDDRNSEKLEPEMIKDMLDRRNMQSVSKENQQENIKLEQTTHMWSGRPSKPERRQNFKDDERKRRQFTNNINGASLSTSTDVITSSRSAASQRSQIKSTDSTQIMSDKVQVPLTSQLPDVANRLHTASLETTLSTVVRSLTVDSDSVAPLPVQSRHSAAAIAMLGGYADWMVGLISAVAVAVFIFLAILSFLAVVSCRCVSSR